ncbi:Fungalysin metallopeptidase-domain-containing protein [Fomes fomentarius]|nr:Fungalysin metallopeptidase-domain-containing protein [Fomes fomentarius]
MFAFKKVFASVFLAVLCASTANAVPYPLTSKYATHRTREISADFKLEAYHPSSSYETFGEGIDHPLSKRADASLEDSATAFVQSRVGVDAEEVHLRSKTANEATNIVYFKQRVNGVPVANAVANVAFNKNNKVSAFGSSFVKSTKAAAAEPSISSDEAIATAESKLNGKYDAENFPEPQLEYFAKDDDSLVLTHSFQVRNEEAGTWYEAFVDAHTGDIVSYRVLPIWKEIPTEGFQTLTDPQDTTASPQGWHSDGTTSTTTTAGNNIIAFKNSTSSVTSQSGSGLVFDYPVDLSTAPATAANVDAGRVNAFYLGNSIHDIQYRYGFTEAAYNFQNNNFGKGGSGNDRVTISVQSSAGRNNADFADADVPLGPDHPLRDGALENDIVAHEYTHGLTNRLTGGGTGRCLQTIVAGSLGEGWSDAFADWLHQTTEETQDFVMGQWVFDNPAGFRSYPYSTSAMTNPLRYSSIKTLNEAHGIGELWANILHNVYAALVDAHGFAADARTNPSSSAGNVVYFHLFVDALQLQPCNPTPVSARDAWIQADVNRYGGVNKCLLWKAFASRGLGQNAAGSYDDDSTVPSDC